MRISVGSDHAGFNLKRVLVDGLVAQGHEVRDVGTHEAARCDYPDFAVAVAREVASKQADLGVLVCGSGLGMAIAANKVAGVRAVAVSDTFSAHASREHNDANVLCLGERVVGAGLAWDILDTWLRASFEGGRHADRVAKINALDHTPSNS